MKLKINQQQILVAFHRFPLTLLFSLAATVVSIWRIHNTGLKSDPYFYTFFLGLVVAFGVEIGAEKHKISKWLQAVVVFVILAVFYFFVAKDITFLYEKPRSYISTLAAILVAHLFAAYSPFLTETHGFWSYNKHLFLTILTSFLYTITLGAGLSLAIMGVDNLFNLRVPNEIYPSLWIFLNGFINTLIFTSKVPRLTDLDHSYPKGLKYFTVYVLLPLVSIYLIILFSYEIKILVSWELPSGWVSLMILASAVLGIFAFLLLYPIKDQNAWVARFSRIYYWLLLPLIVLLFAAIYTRVSQYGLTEDRFFVVVLAFWLLGITLYFLYADNIKVIPISLSIVAFLAVFGPFNAFNVSLKNQTKRFNEVLEANNLVKDKKISAADKTNFSKADIDKLNASVEYLARYSPKTLAAFTKIDTDATEWNIVADFYKNTGLPQSANRVTNDYRSFGVSPLKAMNISGYDSMFRFNYYDKSETQNLGTEKVTLDVLNNKIRLNFENSDTVHIDLKDLNKYNSQELSIDLLTFNASSTKRDVKIMVEYGSLQNGNIKSLSGWVLMKERR